MRKPAIRRGNLRLDCAWETPVVCDKNACFWAPLPDILIHMTWRPAFRLLSMPRWFWCRGLYLNYQHGHFSNFQGILLRGFLHKKINNSIAKEQVPFSLPVCSSWSWEKVKGKFIHILNFLISNFFLITKVIHCSLQEKNKSRRDIAKTSIISQFELTWYIIFFIWLAGSLHTHTHTYFKNSGIQVYVAVVVCVFFLTSNNIVNIFLPVLESSRYKRQNV